MGVPGPRHWLRDRAMAAVGVSCPRCPCSKRSGRLSPQRRGKESACLQRCGAEAVSRGRQGRGGEGERAAGPRFVQAPCRQPAVATRVLRGRGRAAAQGPEWLLGDRPNNGGAKAGAVVIAATAERRRWPRVPACLTCRPGLRAGAAGDAVPVRS